MKQKEYFGRGSTDNLRGIIGGIGAKKIFLVCGKSSYELSGARGAIERNLEGLVVTRFSGFSPNPKLEDVGVGLRLFRKDKYDLIVGVGGGSAIDVAKAIKLFYFKKCSRNVPLVAVPTTAGTGSEATYFIVYYKNGKKQSAGRSDLTLPEYSIVDFNFMHSLPKKVLASTGMDALSQAVESYWSIDSTDESRGFASDAIKKIVGNFELAFGGSEDAIDEMAVAANLAGKAINITKTTACHSVAYPITSHFRIPHGHAAGLTLGEMLIYNYGVGDDCNDSRGVDYVRGVVGELCVLLGTDNPESAREKIKELIGSVGLETSLSELGISGDGMDLIVRDGFALERVKNNPRELAEENLRGILKNIF